jgi:class 3 adenylate cyclase
MALPLLGWLYKRIGRWYPGTFLTIEMMTAFPITIGSLFLFSFYWEGSNDEYWTIALIMLSLVTLALAITLPRNYRRMRPLKRWIAGERGPEETASAWATAVSLPLDMLRRDVWIPILLVTIPGCVVGVRVLDLGWLSIFPMGGFALGALAYSALLHYLIFEAGLRPVLVDINQHVSPRLSANVSAIPLRFRLIATIPLIALITGVIVAALTSEGAGGASDLGLDVAIALGVALTVALELGVLLSKSILRPIADLQEATEEVRQGNFGRIVPVTTGDEIGDLAASFNQMTQGLAEREKIREAFGTYLDHEVAEYILSEGFSEEGEEVEVSILFCDVRDFTSFAAQADAKEVVGELNGLFETIVPIVSRHGGHVDKFVGDGLLAVFGAPRHFPDHADRAVRAACEMAATVNSDGARLKIGVGVNTGSVVAGAIGGAGRLNFSVIGDAVNVAARVEAATRLLDRDVLITAETRSHLSPDLRVTDCGERELKGLDRPIALFAPSLEAPVVAEGELVAVGAPPVRQGPSNGADGDGSGDGSALLTRARERLREGRARARERAGRRSG